MDSKDRVPSYSINTFDKGLWKDALPSLQPQGTYREAWSVVNKTDKESGFGVANESSNELFVKIPDGFIVRGIIYAEERDWFVVMLFNPSTGLSEIGVLDEKHKEYIKIVDDNDLPDGKLDFSEDEWISGMELKNDNGCRDLYLYWSSRYWYNHINLDDKCRDYSIEKFRLFRCICGPNTVTSVLSGGGDGIPNGAYQFITQLEDDDHNTTNWFKFTNPIYVAEKDFVGGEPTHKSIKLELTNLDPSYSQVNVALIKTVNGVEFPPEIVFRSNYGSGKLELEYTGQKGDIISKESVQVKNPTYIRGRNLIQKDGRLILYNLLGETNLHYQPLANQIEAEYIIPLVPANEAHLVKTCRADENYIPAIRWNYCDGTHSVDFPISPEPTEYDTEIIPASNSQNCSNCDLPRWAVDNTATRTELNPAFIDAKDGSLGSSHTSDAESYTAPQEKVLEEPVQLPPSFDDLLKQNPQDITAGICDCMKQHVKGAVYSYEDSEWWQQNPLDWVLGGDKEPDWTHIFNLTIGPEDDCCTKMQNIASSGGSLADGLNEILASFDDATRPTLGGQGGTTGGSGATPAGDDNRNPAGSAEGGFPTGAEYCASFGCDKCPGGCECTDGVNCVVGSTGKLAGKSFEALTEEDLGVMNYSSPTTNTESKVHDLEFTDTSGNLISIQNSLSEGRAVILDFFTTWCQPCYDIHTSGVWEEAYTQFGPASSNYKLDIIGIEMDAYTTDSDLNGRGTNTKGDFTNVSYPLVNLGLADSDLLKTVSSYYNVQYYPFAVIIYPDGKTYNVGKFNMTTIGNLLLDPILTGASSTSSGGATESSPTGGGGTSSCGGSGGSCGGGGCSGGSCGGGSGSGSGGCSGGSCGGGKGSCSGGGSCGGTGSCGSYGSVRNMCSYCGSCGNPSAGSGGACWSCTGDYCRHICYEKPQTSRQAIVRLLTHRVSTFKAAKFNRTYGLKTEPEGIGLRLSAAHPTGGGGMKYAKVLVYDEDGCSVIEKLYPIVARGKFGYFESSESYPETMNCGEDGKLFQIWGDLAGKPVRMFRTPSRRLEPHFMSFQEGVIHFKDKGNYELQDSWVRPIWFNFKNITPPTEDMLPKPLCPNNPYTITYIERTPNNKRILASGLFSGTFKGNYYGREYAYPKHAVNSLEFVDRNVENNGSHLGKEMTDAAAYIFHSPDTSFDRPYLPADQMSVDLELYGKGFRHGLYALGEEPDSFYRPEVDQRGTRQSINLNHFRYPIQSDRLRCIKGLTYADADTVCEAPDGITYPLMNMFRESSVYVEFDLKKAGDKLQLNTPVYGSESDASFIGDGNTHQCPIRHAAGWYGSLINYRKDQYGSIEAAPFIPFGIEGTAKSLKDGYVTGMCGDAYIGFYTQVRKAYVSNKVGNDSLDDPNFGSFMEGFLCFGDCSKLPNSGNDSDNKNKANLRPSMESCYPGGALQQPTSDVYYPRTLKTLVMFWVESDTNVWYREIGERKLFETYYPQLGTIPLDSSLGGAPYDDCFLNQFAERHTRITRWKRILRPIIKLAAFILPILWFLKDGFAFKNEYSDFVMFAVRLVMFLVLYVLLLFKIFTCSNINKFLNIRQCLTDSEGGGDEDHLYGFMDNYSRYNYDFSLNNKLELGFSMDSTYDTRKCVGSENNRIVYSNKQRINSPINAWKNFKVNNYLDLPSESGKLQKIFLVGSKMFLHTTDMIWNVFTDKKELKAGSTSIYLGTGDFMDNAQPIMGGVIEGTYGLADPNAAYTSQWGYIFPDREARKWYIFNGSDAKAISDDGLHHYLRENSDFKLLEQFPDYKAVDKKIPNGIGYSFGVDHTLNRIIITKIDYEAKDKSKLTLDSNGKTFNGGSVVLGDSDYFYNKSFTISYDVEEKKWVSNHYYTPLIYAWNRFDMYAFGQSSKNNNYGIWLFNIQGSFQKFFDEDYPMFIEYVVRNKDSFDAFQYVSTEIKSETEKWDGSQYIKGKRDTFDKISMYNSHQSSGELPLVDKDKLSVTEASKEDFNKVLFEFNRRNIQLASIKDRLSDYNESILDANPEKGVNIAPFNKGNHLPEPPIQNNIFEDNYLVNRLEFSKFDNLKVLLKMVQTSIENNTK